MKQPRESEVDSLRKKSNRLPIGSCITSALAIGFGGDEFMVLQMKFPSCQIRDKLSLSLQRTQWKCDCNPGTAVLAIAGSDGSAMGARYGIDEGKSKPMAI